MKTYRQTFDHLYHNKPSAELVGRIDSRIERSKTAQAGRRAFAFGIFALGALAALVTVVQYVGAQAANSGLYDYLSLLVSDSGYVINNWKTAGLSIIESLPMIGITLTIATLLISVYAFKKSAGYIRLSHGSRNVLLSV